MRTTSPRLGAERHADANLMAAAADRIGHQAIEAQAGEQQRQPAEEAGEHREDAARAPANRQSAAPAA